MTDHRLLKGRPVADKILADIAARTKDEADMGALVSITIGDVPEIDVYVRNQERGAAKAGIEYRREYWPADIDQAEAKARIVALNDDPMVAGIILQRPVPTHINVRSLQSAIHPLKDVEGMNPASIGNIVYEDVALAPCTAAAAVELIKETGYPLEGAEVVMIGHSEIVGKPVAMMLMAEGATVTVCHHMTRSVAAHTRRADILVVAVGKAHLIGADMVKPGAVVIDIGINQTDHGIVGDVETDAVLNIAGWITPVPGGVGPVTVAKLMQNAWTAHERQRQAGWI